MSLRPAAKPGTGLPPGPPPWHALPVDVAFEALRSSADGLASDEAERRLASDGPNAVPVVPDVSRWRVLLAQLRSVIVILLVVATAIAVLAGERADAVAIAAVLVLNVALGYAVEIRAHRAIEALTQLEPRRATVLRDGFPRDIDAREVVTGDVLLLDAGQALAADARLVSTAELRVVEAPLTGESVPVTKRAGAVLDSDVPLPDRGTMVYAGTAVAVGSARALVVATGARTELGKIGQLVSETRVEPTPLERRLDALGRQLVWIALGVGAVTGVLAWRQGASQALVLQSAIALAVAAVPEGLPAVATITLALGVRRMARRNALVRRLPSVETLGSVTVICSDKTGTLTTGAMTVVEIRTGRRSYTVTGTGYGPEGTFFLDGKTIDPAGDADLQTALRVGVVANRADAVLADDTWIARGDPTEAALIAAARKARIERRDVVAPLPEIGEVPFSSDRKLMATFHRTPDGRVMAFVKGAPAVIVERCRPTPTNALESNREMAARGLRVLALAYGEVARPEEAALTDLTFAGLAGMEDPPAPGVAGAIRTFSGAGIRTVMITGDQQGTALAIARRLGIPDAQVFFRVSAEEKLRIVDGYQRRGEVVAMLGDGVNDAAALRKADVGVTMGGRGTDVAREAAAVVLQDDRFPTIGVAIEEGRVVFDNIRKFVFYLFSCNLAEVLVLVGAGAAGMPLPLLPIQVLWLNLVTDTVPALALAVEPATGDIMQRRPREPGAEILSGPFVRSIGFYGVLIALPVFAVMAWSSATGIPTGRAVTMNFMVLALAQLLHLGNARDERAVLHPRRAIANLTAVAAVAFVVALQAATIAVPPLRAALRLDVLTTGDWLIVAILSAVPAVAGQALKLLGARR